MNTFQAVAQTTPSIDFGIIKFHFKKDGEIKLVVDHNDRMNNKQVVADIERALNPFIGEPINSQTLEKISTTLLPIVEKLKKSIVAGVKL